MGDFFIDPYIVKILYKTSDDEQISEIYRSHINVILGIVEKVINSNPDKKENELHSLVTEKISGYIKMYYEVLVPNLSVEEVTELDSYIKKNKAVLKDELDFAKLTEDKLQNIIDKWEDADESTSFSAINLGGAMKAPPPQPVDNNPESVAAPVTQPQSVPQQPEQTSQPITSIDVTPPQPQSVSEGDVLNV